MKTKSIYLSFVFAACCFFAGKAQTANYTYDPAGNRLNRTVASPTKSQEEKEDTTYQGKLDSIIKTLQPMQAPQEVHKKTKLTIYPNPAEHYFIIEYTLEEEDEDINIVVEISNAFGQKMKSFNVSDNRNRFIVETSTFKSGIYYVYAINKGALEETAKVIID